MRRTETWPQYIASIILSFLAFVFLFAAISCALLSGTVMSEDYYLKQVNKSTFAATALYELHEVYRSYAAASGVDSSVMQSAIDEQHIRAALSQQIKVLFSGAQPYDYDAYSAETEAMLLEYAQSQGAYDGPELREGVKELVRYATASFASITDSVILELLGAYVVAAKGTVASFVWVLAAAALVCIAAMVFMLRRVSLVLRNFIYLLGALLVSTFVVPVAMQATGFLARVSISPPSMKQYIVACAGGFFSAYWVVFAVVAALLVVCAVFLMIRLKQKRKAMERRVRMAERKMSEEKIAEEGLEKIDLSELNPTASEFFTGV